MKAINPTRGTGFRPIIYSTAAVFAAALALPASAQVPPPPVVPGAPTIISATATANLQAIVSFTPTPTSNNGGAAITGYTATCNSASHTVSGNEQWVGGPSLLVRNLRKGTTYTCSVTATNSAGTGPASAASNSVTPIGAPDAPTIGTATALDGRVRVTYTGPINIGGSPITRYVARCTATGSPAHVRDRKSVV